MTKVRITIEYEIDQTIEEEQQDWANGYMSLVDLPVEHKEAVIRWEEVV
jgi:hypothetical protein